ncbi:hypothetical protein HO133_001420 [Letharia lupina]|uniref:Uncharacterized protein n=1 Tax=Letharia lupina TaxID=560253 RepID=A0A8H6FC36_9LECA|nr:uncharacterized protein HO133_001420 [Letharia lupina]KAF6222334.1 hypothetical protein HO133_001420 [Letharia lupina]
MESSETHRSSQEPRKVLRTPRKLPVTDSKGVLKQAIFARGGEKLQEEIQLQEEQQRRDDEQRAFSEMLARNNED